MTTTTGSSSTNKKIKVAAYCRVSTNNELLLNSLENQIDYFLDIAQYHKDWELEGKGQVFKDFSDTAKLEKLILSLQKVFLDFHGTPKNY